MCALGLTPDIDRFEIPQRCGLLHGVTFHPFGRTHSGRPGGYFESENLQGVIPDLNRSYSRGGRVLNQAIMESISVWSILLK
jgi:hypothetical protein